jgi:hypothetical protein
MYSLHTRAGVRVVEAAARIMARSVTRERRSSQRLPLSPGAASIDLAGTQGVALADLSADGGRLLLQDHLLPLHRRLSGMLRLHGHRTVVELELVRRLGDVRDAPAAGARFTRLSRGASRELSRFLIDGFTQRQRSLTRLTAEPAPVLRLRRPTHIRGLLRLHGLHCGRTLGVYAGDEPLPPRLRVRALGAEAAHLEVTSDGDPELEEGRTYSFLLPASGAALLFRATVEAKENGSARLSFPSEVLQGGFRNAPRLATCTRSGVPVSFACPRGEGRRTTRRSQDVSEWGLSVPFCLGQDLLFPGDRLDDLRVDLPTGPVHARAIVRAVAPRDPSGVLSCGLELAEFESRADRESWRQHVFSRAYPRTVHSDPALAWLAWEVLDASEYLALWTKPEERERLEREFLSSWDSPALVPGHLIVLREESRTVGTFATSRVYPRTWLLHSLGVDRGERRKRRYFLDAARELYAAMLTLLKGETEGRYFVLFVEKEKRWTDLLYGGFVEALPPGSPSVYDDYELFKCPAHSGAAPEPRLPEGWSVEPADPEGLRSLAGTLGRLLTPLEVEAYEYGRETIGLRAFAGQSPVRFRREVFLARHGRDLRAALVAESGSDGVNVFGLLNSCRVFRLAPFEDPAEEAAIARALLAAARGFYRSRGVREFIMFATSPDMVAAAAAEGAHHVATGVRWLASCELLPAWLNYVDEVLQIRRLDVRGEA